MTNSKSHCMHSEAHISSMLFVPTQSWIPCFTSPHTRLFSQIETHKHSLKVQTTWAASFKRRRFHHVMQYRGVALPLWDMIRELCCTQIELSERLPFTRHSTQRIHRRTLQGDSSAKWHTQNGDHECHRILFGSYHRQDFCVKTISLRYLWSHNCSYCM